MKVVVVGLGEAGFEATSGGAAAVSVGAEEGGGGVGIGSLQCKLDGWRRWCSGRRRGGRGGKNT